MPEPYQPVDHLAVFRLVPLNSSPNLSVQSPGTPAGIGVWLGIGVPPARLACGPRCPNTRMVTTMSTMAAPSSHAVRPASLDALECLCRGSSPRPSRGLGGVMCEMKSPSPNVVACVPQAPPAR